jgi:hypothetical protein
VLVIVCTVVVRRPTDTLPTMIWRLCGGKYYAKDGCLFSDITGLSETLQN